EGATTGTPGDRPFPRIRGREAPPFTASLTHQETRSAGLTTCTARSRPAETGPVSELLGPEAEKESAMASQLSVETIVSRLEAQIAFDREREVFHAGQEA